MAEIGTAGARKTVGEDTALKIPAEFALGKRREAATLLVIVLSQPRQGRRNANGAPQGAVCRLEKPRAAYTVTVSVTSLNAAILSKFM